MMEIFKYSVPCNVKRAHIHLLKHITYLELSHIWFHSSQQLVLSVYVKYQSWSEIDVASRYRYLQMICDITDIGPALFNTDSTTRVKKQRQIAEVTYNALAHYYSSACDVFLSFYKISSPSRVQLQVRIQYVSLVQRQLLV